MDFGCGGGYSLNNFNNKTKILNLLSKLFIFLLNSKEFIQSKISVSFKKLLSCINDFT